MRQSSRPVYFGLLALLVLLIFLASSKSPLRESRQENPSWGTTAKVKHPSDTISDPITNNTLGFSNVFVVGLPERTDKRDAIALTSTLTGFHVEFVDGVKGETIPDQAVPLGVDRAALMESNLGSWRAHMNAIRKYVLRDPGTAVT